MEKEISRLQTISLRVKVYPQFYDLLYLLCTIHISLEGTISALIRAIYSGINLSYMSRRYLKSNKRLNMHFATPSHLITSLKELSHNVNCIFEHVHPQFALIYPKPLYCQLPKDGCCTFNFTIQGVSTG